MEVVLTQSQLCSPGSGTVAVMSPCGHIWGHDTSFPLIADVIISHMDFFCLFSVTISHGTVGILNIVTAWEMSRHDTESNLQACSVLHKANPVFFHQEALNICAGKTVGLLLAWYGIICCPKNVVCINLVPLLNWTFCSAVEGQWWLCQRNSTLRHQKDLLLISESRKPDK